MLLKQLEKTSWILYAQSGIMHERKCISTWKNNKKIRDRDIISFLYYEEYKGKYNHCSICDLIIYAKKNTNQIFFSNLQTTTKPIIPADRVVKSSVIFSFFAITVHIGIISEQRLQGYLGTEACLLQEGNLCALGSLQLEEEP